MPATLTAVVFASSRGNADAPLEVRRRRSLRRAPRAVMTLLGSGWTVAGDSTRLDGAAVDQALDRQLGLRRVMGSEWTPLPVDGGVEWHAEVEALG